MIPPKIKNPDSGLGLFLNRPVDSCHIIGISMVKIVSEYMYDIRSETNIYGYLCIVVSIEVPRKWAL